MHYANILVSVDPSFPVKWLPTTKHDLIIAFETKKVNQWNLDKKGLHMQKNNNSKILNIFLALVCVRILILKLKNIIKNTFSIKTDTNQVLKVI